MSRLHFSLPVKLLPAALAAALVMLGSTAVANAQYYGGNPPDSQVAPPDQSAQNDPPDRVARLAYLTGDVEFAPAGETDWGSADINRPLITGDRLLTGDGGRAALELGDAALRIDGNSAFNFLDLDDTTTQVELSQGTLNLRVRRVGGGQVYEVDTPTVAFVAGEPGTYRVDVAPSGNGAMVTVFEGSGTVYGENGVTRPVQAGQSYRFNDSSLADVQAQAVPAPDDFDRFCESRDSRYTNSVSSRYVSPDVVGYDDLDQYGDWQDTADYGQVWYPTRVATGWAPYRDGHWAWVEPWGWTWVDNEPWGYAPFHYGRWAYVGNRWGWVPGPRTVRAVYAPALVAFVGGSGFSVSVSIGGGNPVGWFPLGPRDVYVPPYRASRQYFTSVNVANIRNVYVNKTVINNYYGSYAAGRPYAGTREYAYRNNPHAFTVVPRNVFAGARPVSSAVLHVKPTAFAKATVAPIPHVAPTRASLAITPAKRPIPGPMAKAFDRTVVARHAPPPRPVPFAAREKVIARQGGAPIPVAQLHQMRQQHAQTQPQAEHVHVVAAAPKPGAPGAMPSRPGNAPAGAPHNQAAMVQAPRRAGQPPERPSNHPMPVPNAAQAAAPNRAESLRPGELPSARFAHPHGTRAPQQPAGQAQQNAQERQLQQRTAQQQAAQQRQSADHEQTQQREAQQRAAQQQAQQQRQQADHDQAQQRAEQQRQHADQAQAAQQQAQARQHDEQMHAQQVQQQATQEHARQQQQAEQQHAQEQQRQAQAHAQQGQQRQAQMHAQQEQQREAQAHAQQEQQRQAQAHAQQEQQRQAQAHAQQEQQREAQAHAQQEQQREAQMHAQQEQQQQAQMHAQHQHAPPQNQQHAPPPPPKKKKDHDQQDNGH